MTVPPFKRKRRRREKKETSKQAKTRKIEEKEKNALIGPGGRQPRAERGRGLCERSEFRSPRARRRRASEKARYRAAVLLGSFFSPKRRMNRKAPWIPHRVGNDSPLTLQGKRVQKRNKQRHTNREKGETVLIGPGGRQPRAERGRGLCERSEFRSPARGVGERAKKPDTGRWFFLVRSSHRREE